MTQPDNGLNLSPEIKGRALIPLHDMPFEFRISDKCRAELEKMEQRRTPTGTNLFSYTQAEAMVRFILANFILKGDQ